MKDRDGQFTVRGSHGRISGCTLPPWTPSDIVDSMNEYFGAILREDLVTLMDSDLDSHHFRNRCKSTGSDTLSLDSYDGIGGGFLPQTLDDTLPYDGNNLAQ
jgi:hypothetical protein